MSSDSSQELQAENGSGQGEIRKSKGREKLQATSQIQ